MPSPCICDEAFEEGFGFAARSGFYARCGGLPFLPKTYTTCCGTTWVDVLFSSSCNLQAAFLTIVKQDGVAGMLQRTMQFFVVVTIIIFLVMSLLFILVPGMCLMHHGKLGESVKNRRVLRTIRLRAFHIRKNCERHVGLYVYFKAFLYYLDYASDGLAVYQYMSRGHYLFGGILLAIYMTNICASLRFMGMCKFYHEAHKSYQLGVYTDKYIWIRGVDEGIEAVPCLLIQLYALPYVTTDSWFACGSFIFTISLTLYSISDAVYQQLHLGIDCIGDDGDSSGKSGSARTISSSRSTVRHESVSNNDDQAHQRQSVVPSSTHSKGRSKVRS